MNRYLPSLLTALLIYGAVCTFSPQSLAQAGAGKITFESSQATGTSSGSRTQIGLMNADGSSQTNLSNNKFDDWNPSLDHIGSKVVFLSDRTGTTEIYVMNADGTNQVRVSNNAANKPPWAIAYPSFSPDGKKILFNAIPINVPNATWEIYLMNADGTNLTQLTSFPPGTGGPVAPIFTPDGSKILFLNTSSVSSSSFSLYAMNLDGSGITLVLTEGGNSQPAMSPDGSKILLTVNGNIVLAYADGSGEIVLESGGGNGSPIFNPDGTKIGFGMVIGGAEETFTANLDGTNLAQLTFGPGISPPSSIEGNVPGSWAPGTVGFPSLISLSLNPTTVRPGSPSQGTVSLNKAAPTGGAVVVLASDSTSASVPASVTVAAGATSATFPISTSSVSILTIANVTALFDGVSQAAALKLDPSLPADTVVVTKAEYTISQKQLRIEATSTSLSATLSVYETSTGNLIGTMVNAGGGKYQLQVIWPTIVQNITIKSSLGGSAASAVTIHS